MKDKFLEIAGLIPRFDSGSVVEITPEMFRYFFDKKKYPTVSYLLGLQDEKKYYSVEDLNTTSVRMLVALSILLYQEKLTEEDFYKSLNIEPEMKILISHVDCEDHFFTYSLISKVIKRFRINPVFIFDRHLSKYDSIFLI